MTLASPPIADAELQTGLRGGDPSALTAIYDRYGSLAYSVALRILGDPGLAEEVVQDVMTSLWRKPERFDAERGSFRSWFLTVTRNRAIDLLRGRQKRGRHETELDPGTRAPASATDPWQAVAEGLERNALTEAMHSIPNEQREAIELTYFAGYSQTVIASRLGIPLGTVKGRQRLGLEKLHSYLTGRGLIQP